MKNIRTITKSTALKIVAPFAIWIGAIVIALLVAGDNETMFISIVSGTFFALVFGGTALFYRSQVRSVREWYTTSTPKEKDAWFCCGKRYAEQGWGGPKKNHIHEKYVPVTGKPSLLSFAVAETEN